MPIASSPAHLIHQNDRSQCIEAFLPVCQSTSCSFLQIVPKLVCHLLQQHIQACRQLPSESICMVMSILTLSTASLFVHHHFCRSASK